MSTILTGASSGLGLALAHLLRDRDLVGVSRGEMADPPFVHIRGDAAKRATALRALEAAEAKGPVTLLINCAGAGVFGPAGSYDDDSIARVLGANLVATIAFCDAIFPRMSGGTIVNVLSTAALTGKPNETVYCAAKWGARGYSEALRAEAKGKGVRVMTVAPGGMNTAFWPEERESFMDPKEVAAVIVDAIDRPVAVTELVIQR
jgi:short-subunit dehydrogenase